MENAFDNMGVLVVILGLLSFPGFLLLMFDHSMGTSFYLWYFCRRQWPLDRMGGDPICINMSSGIRPPWKSISLYFLPAGHSFWKYFPVHARKPMVRIPPAMVYSVLAIAFLSFECVGTTIDHRLVWIHIIRQLLVIFTLIHSGTICCEGYSTVALFCRQAGMGVICVQTHNSSFLCIGF